jgi:hypothetical protein
LFTRTTQSPGSHSAVHRYPFVYAVVALPLIVVRFKTHFGNARNKLPTETLVVEFLFGFSGAFNVLLFLCTRPNLLLPRNMSSRRNKSRMVPSITVTDRILGVSGPYSISRLDTGERSQGQSFTQGSWSQEDDIGLNLPTLKHDSDEPV